MSVRLQFRWSVVRVLVLAISCACAMSVSVRAQQQGPEDPEDEKRFGLWLDQGISTPISSSKSLEVEFHERLDEGATNLFEYFVQAGEGVFPKVKSPVEI